MGLSLGALKSCCEIDMVTTVAPGGRCPEKCPHCGAFEPGTEGDQVELTKEQLRENLMNTVGGVGGVRSETRAGIVADFLGPWVTTDPSIESTNGDAFLHAARFVDEFTGGRSKMLCISRGIRQGVKPVPGRSRVVRKLLKVFEGQEAGHELGAEEKAAIGRMVQGLIGDEVISEDFAGEISMALQSPEENLSLRLGLVDRFLKRGYMTLFSRKSWDEAERRLEEIVELMKQGVVPVFDLTLDFERSEGRISPEATAWSYIRTLKMLAPILENRPAIQAQYGRAFGRVTISIQGLSGHTGHPMDVNRAHLLCQEVLKRLGLKDEVIGRLKFDEGRPIVNLGMAKEFDEDLLDPTDSCEVIPDGRFNRVRMTERRAEEGIYMRAMARADGHVVWQYIEPGHTYNNTLTGPWAEFDDVAPVRAFIKGKIGVSIPCIAMNPASERQRGAAV